MSLTDQQKKCLNVQSSHTAQPSSAYPFSCSASESVLSEEDEEDEEEEDADEEEELELLLLLAFFFAFASFPLTALLLLTVWSEGWGAVTGDCFLLGPCDVCLVSDWLLAGDRLEVTSERLDSDWLPLLPEGGACDESLGGPCEEEERLFCSLSFFSSPCSGLLSLSVGAFVSFLSRCGEGEDEEEEEELEDDDEEEEDLRGWGTSFGGRWSFSFCLSCSASLCLVLSRSLSLALSLERERLLLLLRCGEGERRALKEEKQKRQTDSP